MKAILVVVLLIAPTLVLSDVVAVGKIQSCLQTSTTDLQCNNKLVATIVLAGGQDIAVQATLPGASTNSDSNVDKALQQPISISIQRKTPSMIYPLYYVRDYNSKPVEQIVYTQDILVPSCKDGDSDSSPTCGWQYDSNGAKIPYSQGFCCSCSLSQLLGISKQGTRASLGCQLFATQHSSASCLRYNSLWYSAYEIGSGQKSFDVTVTLTQQGGISKQMVVSPSVLAMVDQASGVKVSLQGDFASYQNPPSFDSKYLFMPSKPATNSRVQNQQANSLLLEKQYTGPETQCDVIGTGYQAFRLQANGCAAQPNACLQNQIEDYVQQDATRISNGQQPLFSLSAYDSTAIVPGNGTGSQYSLKYPIPSSGASVLTLEINADNLKFITKVSPGIIMSATVLPFASLSRQGRMVVVVKNTGTLLAGYSLVVTACSSNILPITATPLQIDVGQTSTSTIIINTDTALQTTNQCTVVLMDSANNQQDRKVVTFVATDQVTSVPSADSPANQDGVTTVNGGSNVDTSCAFYNVICLFQTGSWGTLGGMLAGVLVVIGIIIFLIVFTYLGGWKWICCCCKCCLSARNLIPAPPELKLRKNRKRKKYISSDSDSESSESDLSSDSESSDEEYFRQKRKAARAEQSRGKSRGKAKSKRKKRSSKM